IPDHCDRQGNGRGGNRAKARPAALARPHRPRQPAGVLKRAWAYGTTPVLLRAGSVQAAANAADKVVNADDIARRLRQGLAKAKELLRASGSRDRQPETTVAQRIGSGDG